jgi:hypothetical protein
MDEDTEFLQLDGLRSGIKAAAIVAAKMLRDAGWQLHRIHWQSKSARTVAFTAMSPKGLDVHILCPESEVPAQLRALSNLKELSAGM